MLIQSLVFGTKYNEIIEREKLYFSFVPLTPPCSSLSFSLNSEFALVIW